MRAICVLCATENRKQKTMKCVFYIGLVHRTVHTTHIAAMEIMCKVLCIFVLFSTSRPLFRHLFKMAKKKNCACNREHINFLGKKKRGRISRLNGECDPTRLGSARIIRPGGIFEWFFFSRRNMLNNIFHLWFYTNTVHNRTQSAGRCYIVSDEAALLSFRCLSHWVGVSECRSTQMQNDTLDEAKWSDNNEIETEISILLYVSRFPPV